MYADDTVLFYVSNDVKIIEKILNEELSLIETWLGENCLFVNKKKTECLLFGTPGKLLNIHSFNIKIDNKVINRVSEFKYLGITFDQCLTWNDT